MKISYERAGRCIWHIGCTNHFGGIMREERREETRSLMRCQHCKEAGWYPVGAVGERECEPENGAACDPVAEARPKNEMTSAVPAVPAVAIEQWMAEALREMIESHTAEYPAAEQGMEAQTRWAVRKSDAIDAARAALLTHMRAHPAAVQIKADGVKTLDGGQR